MTDDTAEIVQFLASNARAAESSLSARESRILDTINRKIAGKESLQAILSYLFESTRAISPCDRVGIAFLDEDERLVSHTVIADYEPLLLNTGYSEDPRLGSLESILRDGSIRIIHDLEGYMALRPRSASTRLLVREGVRSSLTVPLRVEERIIGVLFRSSRKPRVYTTAHAILQEALAERLAQAVEKVRQIELLRAANDAYFEMLGFVTHELRSPLSSMISSAQLLRDGYLGALTAEQLDIARRIIETGDYLNSLVRDYLNLAKLESGDTAAEIESDVDFVTSVLAPSLEIVRPQLEYKNMRYFAEIATQSPRVHLDPTLFKIVLVNLLSNAIKYGIESGEIRVRAEVRNRRFHLSVWNQGPGFSPADRSRLFRRFSRLKNPSLMKEKGTGVGLYTVWRIVKLHGGRIDARSEPGHWAEFFLEIPQS